MTSHEAQSTVADPRNDVEGTVTILLDRKKASVPRVENETLLESARRAGLSPPFSCEAGNCGTCMAQELSTRLRRHKVQPAKSRRQLPK